MSSTISVWASHLTLLFNINVDGDDDGGGCDDGDDVGGENRYVDRRLPTATLRTISMCIGPFPNMSNSMAPGSKNHSEAMSKDLNAIK